MFSPSLFMLVAIPGKHAMQTVKLVKTPIAGSLILDSILSRTFWVVLLLRGRDRLGLNLTFVFGLASTLRFCERQGSELVTMTFIGRFDHICSPSPTPAPTHGRSSLRRLIRRLRKRRRHGIILLELLNSEGRVNQNPVSHNPQADDGGAEVEEDGGGAFEGFRLGLAALFKVEL